jgi:hypothetical protein
LYAVDGESPLSVYELDVRFETVVNVLAEANFHCRLYETAPLTAAQPNKAEEEVMLPAVKPEGTPHTPGTGIVNEESAENALVVAPLTA